MRYLSVCSGIEAATVAWHNLGWVPAAFSEIEPFPSAVLKHHYPDVPNVGDMTKYREWNFGTNGLDLLVGGTPCQSFSVAGLRKGLDDPRGNLALVYCGILDHFRPKWFVWENVPGVLSSNGGRDFGSFLGALAQLGYGFAYRVLDAQYFGVAQRRRRVFVVGHLGDWRPSAEVLFEPESLRWDSQASRKKGKSSAAVVAPSLTASNNPSRSPQSSEVTQQVHAILQATTGSGKTTFGTLTASQGEKQWLGNQEALSGDYHIVEPVKSQWWNGEQVADTLTCTSNAQRMPDKNKLQMVVEPIPIHNQATRFNGANNGKGNGLGIGKIGDPCPTLTRADVHAVAFAQNTRDEVRLVGGDGQIVGALAAQPGMKQTTYLAQEMVVRRLTPIECERLQGFPDNYTNIPWRKSNDSPDGPRYKALGNSMAVPVMRWIGERIKAWEARQ